IRKVDCPSWRKSSNELSVVDWSAQFAKRTHRMQVSAIRELLKVVARPEVISFAGGIPASEKLPAKEVAEACERILASKHVGALQAWRPFGPHFIGLPMDGDGIRIEEFGGKNFQSAGVKLAYLLPNFQNPSGISLSRERRAQVVELAQQHNFLIVEDDPYCEL